MLSFRAALYSMSGFLLLARSQSKSTDCLRCCWPIFVPLNAMLIDNYVSVLLVTLKDSYLSKTNDLNVHYDEGALHLTSTLSSIQVRYVKYFNNFRPYGPSRDGNIIESKKDNYELMNQPGCGSSRVSFVLGGHKAPEGAFPFIVSFTQVRTSINRNF